MRKTLSLKLCILFKGLALLYNYSCELSTTTTTNPKGSYPTDKLEAYKTNYVTWLQKLLNSQIYYGSGKRGLISLNEFKSSEPNELHSKA